MGDNDGARSDYALAKYHEDMAKEKRQERKELQRKLRERGKDKNAATERGGIGSAAQQARQPLNGGRSRVPAREGRKAHQAWAQG